MTLLKRILKKAFLKFFSLRRLLYLSLSDNKFIGSPIINQPTLFKGRGKIIIGNNVSLGYFPSPNFYNGAIYVEARNDGSKILIGENTFINNNCIILADKSSISIGSNCLIGTNVEILDSDFHSIDPSKRHSNDYSCLDVAIGDNVFLGNNVKVLKGVSIGKNSVIGNNAVVTKNIPENAIAGGNPAKVIKQI